jgi:hypothetical protein
MAKRKRNAIVQKAASLVAACDFIAAKSVLKEIPEEMQTAGATQLFEQAEAALAEIGALRSEIRSRVASKQLGGLKTKVVRLLELQPSDTQVLSLLQQLETREMRQQKERESREPREQKAESALAEISALRNQIRSRLTSKQLEGLKPKVIRLIELQPNDPQLPNLLQQLDAWEARQRQDRES